jgi:hypothetical protein
MATINIEESCFENPVMSVAHWQAALGGPLLWIEAAG